MSASLLEIESRHICRRCMSLKLSTTQARHTGLSTPQTKQHRRYASTKEVKSSERQVHPLGDYYSAILSQPLSKPTSTKAPTTSPARSKPSTTPAKATTAPAATASEEPKIIFSSRLSSPLERRSEIMKKSSLVAGVVVPPRPGEPENCCMSGCVNCVWDRFRDEMEEWAAARKEADKALQREAHERRKQKGTVGTGAGTGTGLMLGEGKKGAQHTMISMDDDGGGSETNWDIERVGDDLFAGVPVGIREFMKTEKRLREKHMRERAVVETAGAPTSTPAHV
ncbi:hypothetical protein B7463_g12077, partial [Scytalidium lignicola]